MKLITKLATMQTVLKQEVRLADRNVNNVNELFTSLYENHKDLLRKTGTYTYMKQVKRDSELLRTALRSMNEQIRETKLRRKAKLAKEEQKFKEYMERKHQLTAA